MAGVLIAWTPFAGCARTSAPGVPEAVWGQRGISDGRLQKPRAIAIDGADRLYIVDMLARLQVFDTQGNLIRGPELTPASEFGKPTGLSFDREGNLLVADTHYNRVLKYTPQLSLLDAETIGGTLGHGPGEMTLVTDAVQDSQGNYYVSEYGEFDRIQKFTADGRFLMQWGGHGSEPGQFVRPQNMVIDAQDRIWVCDACNHRIQVFNTNGELLFMWGELGSEPGQLSYPYDIVVGDQFVWICEYGNHRVQKLTHEGQPVGVWGTQGRQAGQLHNPWGLVRDSKGNLYILDTNNHRVQQIVL